MLEAYKLNLILEFRTGIDEDGKIIKSKATISNLRLDLTDAEILQIAQLFSSLVKHTLVNAYTVSTNLISA